MCGRPIRYEDVAMRGVHYNGVCAVGPYGMRTVAMRGVHYNGVCAVGPGAPGGGAGAHAADRAAKEEAAGGPDARADLPAPPPTAGGPGGRSEGHGVRLRGHVHRGEE